MTMFDFHTHTNFSPDASMDVEDAIKTSIKKGLKEICFTDHIDYDYDGKNNHILFDYSTYFKSLKALKTKYNDRISIKIGVEMGLQPHLLEQYEKDAKMYDFDFIIGSIHSVEKNDLYSGNYFESKTQRDAYLVYFNELKYIVDYFDHFNVLGHIDVIKRYGNYDVCLPLEEYKDITIEIFRKIIEKGKGIELNTSGIRYQLGDYHPSLDIIKLYFDLGGEIITLGSDAHTPEHIAYDFINATKALESIGFKYIATFDKRKPVFHKIKSVY